MVKKNMGNVLELFITEKDSKHRISKEKIFFQDGGIKEDKFFNKDKKREILLSSTYSYDLASKNNIELEYGILGENILIDFNPYKLDIGTKLQIGDVLFEISMNCPICKHLSKVKDNLPQLLKDDRGIFLKVLKDGYINKNDKVYLI